MIRTYKESEIPQLVDIWEKAARLAHPFLSEAFHAEVKKAMRERYLPNSDTWVYEETTSGQLLGFISMLKNEIGGLFVLPDHQGKGIGSRLLTHIHQFHDTLEVEVFDENRIGKPFYEKIGFRIIQEYIHEETHQKVLRMKHTYLHENTNTERIRLY
ncbi:MAG: N-acetyltransferase [Bacteroidota bacterium]